MTMAFAEFDSVMGDLLERFGEPRARSSNKQA